MSSIANAESIGSGEPRIPARPDRKLGDEWRDWGGGHEPEATQAGKRLFIKLSAALWLVSASGALLAWYLIAPRLTQWHPLVATGVLCACALALALLVLALVLATLTLWLRWPLPRQMMSFFLWLIAAAERRVFALGQHLAISRDRIAHSLIKVRNTFVSLDEHRTPTAPERVLVLLPRCLIKAQLEEAHRIAERYGVHVAVVAGGELARQRISEWRPTVVIGVACERDLVSGIRDVGNRIQVLGIPNTRPHGPCKDTVINLEQLSRAIAFYVDVDRQPEAAHELTAKMRS